MYYATHENIQRLDKIHYMLGLHIVYQSFTQLQQISNQNGTGLKNLKAFHKLMLWPEQCWYLRKNQPQLTDKVVHISVAPLSVWQGTWLRRPAVACQLPTAKVMQALEEQEQNSGQSSPNSHLDVTWTWAVLEAGTHTAKQFYM